MCNKFCVTSLLIFLIVKKVLLLIKRTKRLILLYKNCVVDGYKIKYKWFQIYLFRLTQQRTNSAANVILRATRLSNKLLEQGYVKERLKSSLKKFYGRYGDLIKQYEVPLSRMLNDIL